MSIPRSPVAVGTFVGAAIVNVEPKVPLKMNVHHDAELKSGVFVVLNPLVELPVFPHRLGALTSPVNACVEAELLSAAFVTWAAV
jgi:hypothetical protein